MNHLKLLLGLGFFGVVLGFVVNGLFVTTVSGALHLEPLFVAVVFCIPALYISNMLKN